MNISFINMKQKITTLIVLILLLATINAEPRVSEVKVLVTANNDNWTYNINELVQFEIAVYQHGHLLKDINVKYEIRKEKRDLVDKGEVLLQEGTGSVSGGTMENPGFIRCKVKVTVDGIEYTGIATAGFSPYDIMPTTDCPEDFEEFWENAKAENKTIPFDTKMTLIPERCTSKSNVYHISFQNYKYNSRMYGVLCIPKAEGKYPAILRVPGAGIRPYYGMVKESDEGLITLVIGIHGIPVTMDKHIYEDLRNGALNNYQYFNLDDRNTYYYKRVYLGCARAADVIYNLSKFDGDNLAVQGGSQGGALSIVTASLNRRVKFLAPFYPALCDLTGHLFNRAGGWPHLFSESNKIFTSKKDKIKTSKYYDVVNFAKNIIQPGFYSWGFNDETCPPTSMFAAYNVINAPKKILIVQDTGHWIYPEQWVKMKKWLYENLNVSGEL